MPLGSFEELGVRAEGARTLKRDRDISVTDFWAIVVLESSLMTILASLQPYSCPGCPNYGIAESLSPVILARSLGRVRRKLLKHVGRSGQS